MRNRKIQRMVKKGEITYEEGCRMAALHVTDKNAIKEEPISYRNSERYADPTAFQAVQRIVREERKKVNRVEKRGSHKSSK